MDSVTGVVLLTFAGVAAVPAALVAWVFVHTYRLYRESRIVTCLETERVAAVRLDARRAAVTRLTGAADLRIKSCSEWPGRSGCGQACLSRIGTAPRDCGAARARGGRRAF